MTEPTGNPKGRPTEYDIAFCEIDYTSVDLSRYGKLELAPGMTNAELRKEFDGAEFQTEKAMIRHFEENLSAYFAFLTGGDLVAGVEREVTLPRGFPRKCSIGRIDMLITGVSGKRYLIEFKNRKGEKYKTIGDASVGITQVLTYKILLDKQHEPIDKAFVISGSHDFATSLFVRHYALPVGYCLLRPNAIYRLF